MTSTELAALKKQTQEVAAAGKSTAETPVEQPDGSVLVLRSVQGDPCEEFRFSAEDREHNGWAPPEPVK